MRRKSLGVRIGLPMFRKSGEGGWITIKPHGEGSEDYLHIKIDGSGRIEIGHKAMQGKTLHEAFSKEKKAVPHLSYQLTTQGVGHKLIETPEGDHQYVIGNGLQHTLDIYGRKTADVGSLGVSGVIIENSFWGKGKWVGLLSNFEDKNELKHLGARFDGESKKWFIPLKDIPLVVRYFPDVTISPKAAKAYEKEMSQDPNLPAREKVTIDTKDGKKEFDKRYDPTWNGKMPEDMQHVNLYEHQKAGVEFLLHHKKAILGYAVGLGKTPTAIAAANIAMDEGKVKRFAVIAPSSVKFQWQAEIEKFSGRKAVVLDNSTPKRLQQSFEDAKDADFIITNYEMLRNSEHAQKIKELAGDAVIADEAHKIKNDTQQTGMWKRTFKDAKYRWLLTATPFPNGQPKETHTMLSHVAPQTVGSWNQFAGEHAVMQTVKTRGGHMRRPVALKNQARLREKMKDSVMLRHHNSPDVNSSLPSARHVTHNIDMTKDQIKIYKSMRDDLMHELKAMTDEQYTQNASNILTKMKRLEQIAVDPDQLDPDHADMNKLYPKEEWAVQTTMDHLENPENRGIVIFSDAKLPIEKVKNGLMREGLKSSEIGVISGDVQPSRRKQIADEFGNGKIKVVLSTSAGEEGVNLQHGGHTMIHLDTPWVPKSITQREGRVLRTGQPNPFTMFYSPTMKGTVEEIKRGKLADKVKDIERLLGEGSAGSASENVAATAKAWSKKDVMEMLADLPHGKVVKKSLNIFVDQRDGQSVFVRAQSVNLQKSQWTTAYKNRLPDSAFLYVSSGGKKDNDGKTVPRSKRHFPVRDANGNIDKDHLDDALARIPDSDFSDAVKELLTDKAEKLLAQYKRAKR